MLFPEYASFLSIFNFFNSDLEMNPNSGNLNNSVLNWFDVNPITKIDPIVETILLFSF